MADHAETVLDAMVTACAAISTGSGDAFTANVTQRFDRYNSTKGPLPNVQIRIDRYRKSREEFGGNWRADLFVELLLLIEADQTGTGDATDKQVSDARASVEEAVIGMDWETLEANLADIDAVPLITEDEDDPDDGVIITFQVQYKLQFDDLSNSIDPS